MDHFAAKIYWSIRLNGVTGTTMVFGRALKRRLLNAPPDDTYCIARDAYFDRHFGVETAGAIEVEDLDVAAEAKEKIYEYRPSSAVSMAVALGSLPIDPAEYHFVDLGCGKGRGLIIAGQMPFRAVTGVELSPTLTAACRENIRLRQGRRLSGPVEVIEGDATQFAVPEGPLLVYLFNPFGEELTAAVARHLEASLRKQPRSCWVVYANARHRHVFGDGTAWQQHTFPDDWWAVYRWRADVPVADSTVSAATPKSSAH